MSSTSRACCLAFPTYLCEFSVCVKGSAFFFLFLRVDHNILKIFYVKAGAQSFKILGINGHYFKIIWLNFSILLQVRGTVPSGWSDLPKGCLGLHRWDSFGVDLLALLNLDKTTAFDSTMYFHFLFHWGVIMGTEGCKIDKCLR